MRLAAITARSLSLTLTGFTTGNPSIVALRRTSSGVPSEIYYPLCIHLQEAFAYLGHAPGDFPESEKASREVLSLPVYPELPDAQQDRVVQGIADFRSSL